MSIGGKIGIGRMETGEGNKERIRKGRKGQDIGNTCFGICYTNAEEFKIIYCFQQIRPVQILD